MYDVAVEVWGLRLRLCVRVVYGVNAGCGV